MPQAAIRFIAGDAGANASRTRLFTALTKRFVVTTGLMAVGIVGYSLWLGMSGESSVALVWAATAVLFLSYTFSAMSLGAAHGLGHFGDAAGKTLIGSLMQPFAVLAGALLAGPAGAILGNAVRHLPQALTLRKYLTRGPTPSSLITPTIKQYAQDNWISGGLTAILQSRLELAVIGFSFSLVEVGYYAVGMTMTGMVIQLSIFLLASLIPYFGSLHDRDDITGLTLAYQRSMRWVGIVLAPICFGGAAIASVLIPSVFGEQFAPAVHLAEVLLAFSFAWALLSVPSRMMLARERSREVLWLSMFWGGVSIALLIAIVPHFGGLGAAWVKGAVGVLFLLSFLWYCKTRLGIPCVPMDIMKVVVAGLLTGVTAKLCMSWIPGLSGMTLGIAIGAIVYPASLLLLSVITPDEKAGIGWWASDILARRRDATSL